MPTSRVAAIDCGTNSIRLLIAEVDPQRGVLTDVQRQMQIVRLGHGVDATGRFDPQALARTLAATEQYAQLCRQHGVQQIRFVATSATRDAENRADFVQGVTRILGVAPEVVSGEQEAQLSFLGASSGTPGVTAGTVAVVVDLGGGSTEFVLGACGGALQASCSTDIGCVRLTERHLTPEIPTAAQRQALLADVDAALDRAAAAVDWRPAAVLIGVAGTVTTVTAHALGLTEYDSQAIHGARLPVETVLAAAADLASMPRAARAALGFMHPGRVDVIVAGALVWHRIVQRLGQDSGVTDVVTSEHDILDGIALSVAEGSASSSSRVPGEYGYR